VRRLTRIPSSAHTRFSFFRVFPLPQFVSILHFFLSPPPHPLPALPAAPRPSLASPPPDPHTFFLRQFTTIYLKNDNGPPFVGWATNLATLSMETRCAFDVARFPSFPRLFSHVQCFCLSPPLPWPFSRRHTVLHVSLPCLPTFVAFLPFSSAIISPPPLLTRFSFPPSFLFSFLPLLHDHACWHAMLST
jgi:hypothetical protein